MLIKYHEGLPPTVNDQNSLIKEINKIYRNKRTIKVYYMVGKLLAYLSNHLNITEIFRLVDIATI